MGQKLFPREKFDAIVLGCMTIVRKHGFEIQPVSVIPKGDSRFSDIFDEACFRGWFGDVASKPKVAAPKKPKVKITQSQMDKMTLECALVFLLNGVKKVHYNESLNGIRMALTDVLEEMGYGWCLNIALRVGDDIWGCYKLWEEVARKDGLPEKEIAETREQFKKNHPKQYETA